MVLVADEVQMLKKNQTTDRSKGLQSLKKLIDCQKKVLKFKNTTIVKEPLKIMMKPNEQI